jgi:hypothetical protein
MIALIVSSEGIRIYGLPKMPKEALTQTIPSSIGSLKPRSILMIDVISV